MSNRFFAAVLIAFVSVTAHAQSTASRSFTNYVATNLEKLNSSKNDFAPFISIDEQTILFVSDRMAGVGLEDFWMSTRNGPGDGDWSEPINLRPLNSASADGAITSTADGQTFYFASARNSTQRGDVDIFVASFGLDGHIKLKQLGGPVNSFAWETQPSISADGKTLFFASNRKGKIGTDSAYNVDLFVSHLMSDDSWSNPVDLGSKINTADYEGSPFIAPDGKTLYFSSHRPGGKGGADIYRSYHIGPSDTDWTDPIDLPEPINSEDNELFVSIPASGYTVYFASDRNGGKGKYDLWAASPANENPSRTYRVQGVQIAIDPNPAHDLTRVNYSFAKDKKYTFTIEDLEGKKMLDAGESGGQKGTLTLNLSSLPPNVYLFVTTSSDGERDVQRLVVVK